MKYFVFVYDRARGKLVDLKHFKAHERQEALDFRFAAEVEVRDKGEFEVVLLSAPSVDVLKKTHSRYFEDPSEIVADMDAAAAAG